GVHRELGHVARRGGRGGGGVVALAGAVGPPVRGAGGQEQQRGGGQGHHPQSGRAHARSFTISGRTGGPRRCPRDRCNRASVTIPTWVPGGSTLGGPPGRTTAGVPLPRPGPVATPRARWGCRPAA